MEMFKYFLGIILLFSGVVFASDANNLPSVITRFSASFDSGIIDDESLDDLQVPIPHSDRIKNYTGTCCVWSSIETIGRWAEEPKLMNPPLTSYPECKSYAGPGSAAAVLSKLGVKFEQSYGNKTDGLKLIRKAMADGRGCLFDVPGHAMVLIHFDEEKKIVKYVNNSDRSLNVLTMSMDQFESRWDSWVLVIYADKDIVAQKLAKIPELPIINSDGTTLVVPKFYIPMPQRKAA